MTDTASLELSKELYKLSGWEYSTLQWLSPFDDSHPVYDLGYLLRKIPAPLSVEFQKGVHDEEDDTWSWYIAAQGKVEQERGFYWAEDAGTPEDVLCMLLIELFKQGILGPDNIDDR